MLRRLFLAVALLLPCLVHGQDATPPPEPKKPPALPMAVKALDYLKAQPNSGPTSWTNGPYVYDGAGNIAGIGSEAYIYDKIGRLKSATLRGPDLVSMQTQSFTYDAYGNLTSTTKLGQTVHLDPELANTNRLQALGYDPAGNVITAGSSHYEYDAVGMLNTIKLGTSSQPRMIYAYTADDERLFAFDVGTSTTHWTLRGFDNKVLRDFKQTGPNWSVERDYIYRDGLLLAAMKPGGAVEHYSLDHLGTPRFITDGSGTKIGYHVYWPFGEEWSPGNAQEASPRKFTGHERDTDPSGGNAPLDYMHARSYGAGWGRFLSVDPVLDIKKAPGSPQGWNRYAYVANNPMTYTDPSGRCSVTVVALVPPLCSTVDLADYIQERWGQGKEAVQGMGAGAPMNEKLMGAGVLGIIALDVGSNALVPEEGRAIEGVTNFGFRSFTAFKRAMGPAGANMEWHHIVEQTSGNATKFGAEALHNNVNVIKMDRLTHGRISAFYSSKIKGVTGDLTVRQWLATQSFAEQYKFGVQVLRNFGVIK